MGTASHGTDLVAAYLMRPISIIGIALFCFIFKVLATIMVVGLLHAIHSLATCKDLGQQRA